MQVPQLAHALTLDDSKGCRCIHVHADLARISEAHSQGDDAHSLNGGFHCHMTIRLRSTQCDDVLMSCSMP